MTPMVPPPPPWTNQPLILYHGTVDRNVPSILRGVDVRRGRTLTDFGRGFYTTTVERQANSWAVKLSQRKRTTHPAIIRFEVNRDALAELECLWFVRASFDVDDFWSLVFHCRRGGSNHARVTNQGWYDVVIGPVVASWQQRLILYDVDQVSFHTDKAADLLNNSNPRRIL